MVERAQRDGLRGGPGAMNVLGGAPGDARWYELSPSEQQEVLAEHRLGLLDEALVNWCPALGDGAGQRGK